MATSLKFLGASQNVTGSCYLLQVEDQRILVDCGLFQERKLQERNWEPFPVDPTTIDAVLLTHAHLDHVGRLPLLVKQGFRGPIYGTAATLDIAKIVLEDCAHIQEEDAAKKAKRHRREGRQGPHPEVPLYTQDEARSTFPGMFPVEYEQEIQVGRQVKASFHDAGHILGSAMIRVVIGSGSGTRSILFSGDVGRWGKPIIRDPTQFSQADYVLVESTYGDRLHEPEGSIENDLEKVVNETHRRGGNLVIPSFAIERTHELLYHLNSLLMKKRIPPLLVFVDSPMAVGVTEVFKRHSGLFDEEMKSRLQSGQSPFDFPSLHLVRAVEGSKAINMIQGSAIIIAGAGMCNGGRIKHHLLNNLARDQSTILFVGYQAQGTLGRQILDGNSSVRIFGQDVRVRARIAQIHGFSAHADRDELLRWLSSIQVAPRRVFVTHGEGDASLAFVDHLVNRTGWSVSTPEYLEEIRLE